MPEEDQEIRLDGTTALSLSETSFSVRDLSLVSTWALVALTMTTTPLSSFPIKQTHFRTRLAGKQTDVSRISSSEPVAADT